MCLRRVCGWCLPAKSYIKLLSLKFPWVFVATRKLLDLVHDLRYRRYLSCRLPTGHDRIYFYHIRKTAGTSLNNMVLASFDEQRRDPDALWNTLWAAHRHRMLIGGKVFVAGERKLIESGKYFYATSHLAAHEISLPKGTFTVTCLRDPVDRVVSHYRMLLSWKKNNSSALKKEGQWLGSNFREFLDLIPKEHLLRQIYTFSAKYDVAEAFDKICRTDFWFFTRDLDSEARKLGERLGFVIESPLHMNSSEVKFLPMPEEKRTLEELLAPEIELYSRLVKLKYASADITNARDSVLPSVARLAVR